MTDMQRCSTGIVFERLAGYKLLGEGTSMFFLRLVHLAAFVLSALLFSPSIHAQDSLADAARKNRPADAEVTTERSWTSDDMASARVSVQAPPPKTPEEASETIRKFR
jgi:hypothetical protein